jgi:hypothetical protein
MTFLSKLKYTVLLVAFCFSAGANAGISPTNLTLDATTGEYAFSHTSMGAGATFSDSFNFTLADGYDLVLGSFAPNKLNNWTISVFDSKNTLVNGALEGTVIKYNGLETSGVYRAVISGQANTSTGNGHNYSGYFQIAAVSPVPEAETYAMLLAGLGVIGFISRRRLMTGPAIAA